MEFSARQIADVLEGEIQGDPEARINRFSKIEEGEEGAISFLANLKYAPYLYDTLSSVVIIGKDFKPEREVSATLILVEDPKQSFTQLLAFITVCAPKNRDVRSLISWTIQHLLGMTSTSAHSVM